jgi:hypothetical protein
MEEVIDLRFGNPTELVEAIDKAKDMLDYAESFTDDIASDLEKLISDMERYDDGDDKDILLDGIQNFIDEARGILGKIK